jgi:ferrous iron transport protein A
MPDSEVKDNYKCELDTAEMSNETISLNDLHIGDKGKIAKITGGRTACKRLNELGLIPGTEVELVNKISSGPVMIKVKGSKLALGRGLASKVLLVK